MTFTSAWRRDCDLTYRISPSACRLWSSLPLPSPTLPALSVTIADPLTPPPPSLAGIINSLLGWAVYLVCCRWPPSSDPRPGAGTSPPGDQRTGLLTTEQPPAAASAARVSLVTANGS